MDDRNQPVGARLGRFLRSLRNEDAEAYGAYLQGQEEAAMGSAGVGRKTAPTGNRSMRDVIRGVEPPAQRDNQTSADITVTAQAPSAAQRMSDNSFLEMNNPVGTGKNSSEVDAAIAARNAARAAAAARSNARIRPRSAPANEMSADDLNAMSLTRGVGADNAPDTAAAANIRRRLAEMGQGMKKGGKVKKMAKGGVVKSSASSRGDGCAARGKTKGRMV